MKNRFLILCMAALLFGSCTPPSVRQPLKVMTFNIRLDIPSDSANSWEFRKENVYKMIAYYQPDLLGMQEVCCNQMEDLKEGLPEYTALGVGRDDGKKAGEFCPVFFNTRRFSLVDYGNFALSEHPERIGVKGWDASYNRVVTWAVLQEVESGKKLVFFNTHLDNDGQIARKESARLIQQKMKELAPDMPAILTGDFNCLPDEEPLQILEAGILQNAGKAAAVTYGPAYSFHDFGRLQLDECVLLDYVMATNDFSVNRYRVIQDKPDNGFLSDHYPVLVELNL